MLIFIQTCLYYICICSFCVGDGETYGCPAASAHAGQSADGRGARRCGQAAQVGTDADSKRGSRRTRRGQTIAAQNATGTERKRHGRSYFEGNSDQVFQIGEKFLFCMEFRDSKFSQYYIRVYTCYQSMIVVLFQAQRDKAQRQMQQEQEEALAMELKRLQLEKDRDEKMRQQIRETRYITFMLNSKTMWVACEFPGVYLKSHQVLEHTNCKPNIRYEYYVESC
jgi:hypothetical protein